LDAPIYHLEKVVRVREDDVEDFNGPLDLILSLLSKNKMEIQDIQIAVILEQYLAWMDKRRSLDMEIASEFVAMAAQLIFIKTRMLLSVHDEEAISELDELIASLEEHQRHENYKKIQAVLPALSRRYAVGRDYITKGPEHLPAGRLFRYTHTLEELYRAMTAALDRVDHHLPPPMTAFEGIVGREPYPVADKAGEILERLRHFGVASFHALFRGNRSRSEIVATFLAVLELCRARRVRLAGTPGECTVTATGGEEGEMEFSSDG